MKLSGLGPGPDSSPGDGQESGRHSHPPEVVSSPVEVFLGVWTEDDKQYRDGGEYQHHSLRVAFDLEAGLDMPVLL